MSRSSFTNLVVVGGGSAGWLMACRLAARYCGPDSNVSVTLVESPEVNTVGVGEGTWPTMRSTLKSIGLSETQFLRQCQATLKQGTCFDGWRLDHAPNRYYHPFDPPRWHAIDYLSEDWLRVGAQQQLNFGQSVSPQPAACELNLAAKTISHAQYQGVLNYGYHLDAGQFALLLRDHGINKLGVKHRLEHIAAVDLTSDGFISHLLTNSGQTIAGDLFFDCSGFEGLLLRKTLGVAAVDLSPYLLVNQALAVQVPCPSDSPIASTTRATAHDAGWIWDIGLQNRRGVGCLFSDQFIDQDRALATLAQYLDCQADELSAKNIGFNAHYLQQFWCKNAVAVGLSSGFVEPLEASALVLVELAADWFCERLPRSEAGLTLMAQQYNKAFRDYWEEIVDFLKLHYALSQREGDFWQENRRETTIPESLRAKLALWQEHPPSAADQQRQSKVFSWESYLYVYNGMQASTNSIQTSVSSRDLAAIDHSLARVAAMSEKVRQSLPTNRQFIESVRQHQMTSI